MHVSHRVFVEYGSYYLQEGLAGGYVIKPYFEFTNPLSDFQFYQLGAFVKKSMYRNRNFNWIAKPRLEYGNPLPRYQLFELGGTNLRSFPAQIFRSHSYAGVQNDFLLGAVDVWKIKFRPLAYADWAYIENGGRTGIGLGLQAYFLKVDVPAVQIYGGYGFHPNGFAIAAAIGPQI